MSRRTFLVAAAGAAVLAGCGSSASSGSSGSSGANAAGKGSSSSSSKSGGGGAYGYGSQKSSSGGGGGSGAAVPVAADPSGALKFTASTLKAKAGTVTFRFTNKSSTPHALEIEGHGVEAKTSVVTGSSAAVTVKLKPGRYEFYCPVDGHRAAGMHGTLKVS